MPDDDAVPAAAPPPPDVPRPAEGAGVTGADGGPPPPHADVARWPMHMALAVVGGKWKLILVCRIRDGVTRFGELQRSIPTLSEKVLAAQLRELERDGVITRTVHPDTPPRVEYGLTPIGRALQPVADAVWGWGRRYLDEHWVPRHGAGGGAGGG